MKDAEIAAPANSAGAQENQSAMETWPGEMTNEC
jgi:hypothetical protein